MVLVRQSTIIDAPIDTVWHILRDFNGHDRWHPAVATSAIEDGLPVDAVGAVRRFRLADGAELREQLLALSDDAHTFSYCILEAPLPLMGYVATVRLKPVTDGNRTFWEWRSEFHPPAPRHDEPVSLVRDGIYRAGFEAIRRLVERPGGAFTRAPPPSPLLPSPLLPSPLLPGPLLPSPLLPGATPTRPMVAPSVAPFTGPGLPTRAVIVDHHGGPEVLRLRDIGLPLPAPGEVRVRHTAIGVNFIDVYCRTGYFDLLTPPGVPGMEAAGVIEALGERVAGLRVGERVAYACPPVGAYAERRNMAPDLLVRLADDVPDEIAAAGLLKGVTASFLLHDVHAMRPGETVLVHAAAGGVGQLLVQWARHLGATVIATVSTDDKARIVEQLGADHVVIHGREDFAAAVLRLTGGRGADVVYDAIGADTFARSLEALAIRGHLVSFGQASGDIGTWPIGALASKSVTISRPNYGHYTDTAEKLAPHVARLFAAWRQRLITIAPPRRYALADAAEAHRDLEGRRTTGSLVLIP
jgi:NADPH:quinone reductase-like Zn-dependent oxidoreductase